MSASAGSPVTGKLLCGRTEQGRGPRHLLRALAMLAAMAPALSGCADADNSLWGQLYTLGKQSLDGPPKITLADAEKIPYASIGVQIGDGPQFMLVLATDESGTMTWTSPTHIVLVTRDGRIVRTAGLARNLNQFVNVAQPTASGAPIAAGEIRYEADFEDMQAFSVPITCRAKEGVPASIKILGAAIAVLRVDEDCRAPTLDWNFQNTFWLDRTTGFVWRSRQHIHPKFDPVEIEVLRPPG